jgi:DNA-binding protein H-NS
MMSNVGEEFWKQIGMRELCHLDGAGSTGLKRFVTRQLTLEQINSHNTNSAFYVNTMPTVQDLIAQKEQLAQQLAAVEKQITAAQSEKRTEAIAKVRALLAEYGLTAADLGGSAPKAEKAAKPTSTVAAKYRDPESGKTWSGRGLKPRWLTAAIATGKTPADFAI